MAKQMRMFPIYGRTDISELFNKVSEVAKYSTLVYREQRL